METSLRIAMTQSGWDMTVLFSVSVRRKSGFRHTSSVQCNGAKVQRNNVQVQTGWAMKE